MFYNLLYLFKDEIGLKEWLISLKSTHKDSLELLSSMAKKATKIYGSHTTDNRIVVGGQITSSNSPPTHPMPGTPLLNSRNGN